MGETCQIVDRLPEKRPVMGETCQIVDRLPENRPEMGETCQIVDRLPENWPVMGETVHFAAGLPKSGRPRQPQLVSVGPCRVRKGLFFTRAAVESKMSGEIAPPQPGQSPSSPRTHYEHIVCKCENVRHLEWSSVLTITLWSFRRSRSQVPSACSRSGFMAETVFAMMSVPRLVPRLSVRTAAPRET